MIVGIHQPQYLPWLGYFDKIDKSDVFVFLDCVQFKKNEFQNRNRIRSVTGWQWLTVPVRHNFGQKINKVPINAAAVWKKKHCQALLTNYAKAPFFKDYFPFFEDAFSRDWDLLSPLNTYLVQRICSFLLIRTRFVIASGLDPLTDPSGRLVDICKKLGADTYLAGKGGTDYMDMVQFEKAGIQVLFQDFKHPEYPQVYKGFEPLMSVVDILFNQGPEGLMTIRKANP